ncbi:hypothetical protein B0H13DRAFT_2262988 [Mycena leptocephala]|nr:hypothetical protein B0H13DRAFT_2262988 [Mycena leptocephala]
MSEQWQPVPLRDNIDGSEPMNPANINRSQLSHYPGTSVPPSACARDSRSVNYAWAECFRAAMIILFAPIYPFMAFLPKDYGLAKPVLVSLGALHGIGLNSKKATECRNIMAAHLGGGSCGFHRSGYRHLGSHNGDLDMPSMDLAASMSVDLELAQIHILASVAKTLSQRPLQRVLEMHKVEFSTSDGTSLRKHLRSYSKRLRLGKKVDSFDRTKTQRNQELSALRSDWPTMVPMAKKRDLVGNLQHIFFWSPPLGNADSGCSRNHIYLSLMGDLVTLSRMRHNRYVEDILPDKNTAFGLSNYPLLPLATLP